MFPTLTGGLGAYSPSRLFRALVRSKLDYECFIYRALCKSLLDSIQNQSLRISLRAFRTSPAQNLCIEANERPLELCTKIAANPNNPVYETISNPSLLDILLVILTFGIRIRELEEYDFNHRIIVKIQFPEYVLCFNKVQVLNRKTGALTTFHLNPTGLIIHREVLEIHGTSQFKC